MRRAWLVAVLLMPSVAARADDWLAVLPACALHERAAVPVFELVYPRPGLPALVAAGDTLIARVRLPSPLTPPPGVQQRRALSGWQAALIGHALALADGAAAEQRYPLEVSNVRPDGASSLVYRTALHVPAWAAPGTYDLTLSAPGGSDSARALVRVLSANAAARLAWTRGVLPARDAIAALPIDAFVRAPAAAQNAADSAAGERDAASALVPVPALELAGLSAALRIGDALWVIGDCDTSQPRFADEVASVLARERRTRLDAQPLAFANGDFAPWGEAWQAWPAAAALRIAREGSGVRVAREDARSAAEIGVLFESDGGGLRSTAGALRFFPAGEIDRSRAPALIGIWQLAAADGDAQLERSAAAEHAWRLLAEPAAPRSAEHIRVRVVGAERAPFVAFRFDALHSAFAATGAAAEHAYPELGPQRIDALAIAGDGTIARLHTTVQVGATHGEGCRCTIAPRTRRPPWPAPAVLLLCLVRLGVRRRRAKKQRGGGEPE